MFLFIYRTYLKPPCFCHSSPMILLFTCGWSNGIPTKGSYEIFLRLWFGYHQTATLYLLKLSRPTWRWIEGGVVEPVSSTCKLHWREREANDDKEAECERNQKEILWKTYGEAKFPISWKDYLKDVCEAWGECRVQIELKRQKRLYERFIPAILRWVSENTGNRNASVR